MARNSSSGMPFLTRRKDTGKYVYWRTLDAVISPSVHGDISRSWAISGHRLTGRVIVKISLQTGSTS
jgi:hypothetical protein